ncbi:glutathione-regulated potassium-efflux system ancillary protein KefG [Budviciaceae bacterium BWR-B9]|uniref:Glutathione-regulated potassium-efflux system ancillary protein KefG n=1 Tax=Limnobaculum allomyrinae TaxID=2791986 RepID=A0ABS1IR99_9GAMM|nr:MULTISPECIES: glutathione-regulated potassium-efflux system ancillary protein KefG [Limnobaculum]MBK5144106.1 glutathione-regulated potassium-efflux system ancillary protein KefG [Limnobaculum allomyrinae]MBV7691765.1 glutathione-regulated potassium-efflux system ancillary protein KefG [Limnobaculum sp. M2-1]
MSHLPKALVLFAHPEPKRSVANKALLKVIRNLDNVTVRDLYAYYPDFFINAHREHQLLRDHEVIIFQFPIHTYSCPALMKEWIDRVLNLQFAGSIGANELSGKRFRLVVTAGATESNYQPGGSVGYTFDDILLPFKIMAKACGMEWIEPMIIYRARRLEEDELQQHALKYAEWLSVSADEDSE